MFVLLSVSLELRLEGDGLVRVFLFFYPFLCRIMLATASLPSGTLTC